MRGQLYRNCHIFSMAQLHGGGWIPAVRVTWSQEGQERQVDLEPTDTFTTQEQAEEHGLVVGKKWVDEQLAQGNISG